MKVAINTCFGGFGLSPQACLWLYEHGFKDENFLYPIEKYYGKEAMKTRYEIDLNQWKLHLKNPKAVYCFTVFTPCEKFVLTGNIGSNPKTRSNPLLIECIEKLKEASWDQYAKLSIVEIPDDIEFTIEEYDGLEHIAEAHRTWQ